MRYASGIVVRDEVIFRKALALAHEQRQRFGVGPICSFMQVDTTKLGNASSFMHELWSIPLQICIGSFMLYSYLQSAGLIGVGVMCLVLPTNLLISKRLRKYNEALMKARDERTDYMNELLQGIKALKLYAWEPMLMSQVEAKRATELSKLRMHQLWLAAIIFCLNSLPTLVTAVSFLVFSTVMGEEINATIAFPALIVFNIITIPLLILPFVINAAIDVLTVNKRLSRFLNAPSRAPITLDDDGDDGCAPHNPLVHDGHYTSARAASRGGLAVEMANANFCWPAVTLEKETEKDEAASKRRSSSRRWWTRRLGAQSLMATAEETAAEPPMTLSGLNLSVRSGALVGIAGPVASGKSSLLLSLVGDVPRVSGRVCVRGSVAYCAQTPWIQNATLRANVLFGRAYDKFAYAAVLSACALDADLQCVRRRVNSEGSA